MTRCPKVLVTPQGHTKGRQVPMANASIAQAVNRAALNLEAVRWSFDGDTLKIESATNSGTFYTVTVEACECKAGQKGEPCWHRAGCRLLVKAAEMVYTASSTNGYQDAPVLPFEDSKPTMAELQAAAD